MDKMGLELWDEWKKWIFSCNKKLIAKSNLMKIQPKPKMSQNKDFFNKIGLWLENQRKYENIDFVSKQF